MKITFGTVNGVCHARSVLLTLSAFVAIVISVLDDGSLSYCHELIDRVKTANVTSFPLFSQCHDRLFERCLCNATVNLTRNSDACFTDLQLRSARILPLASYVLQLFAVRELFTLDATDDRTIIRAAWAMCPFISIGIIICIHIERCYRLTAVLSLFSTGSILMLLMIHDCELQRRSRQLRRNTNIARSDHQTLPVEYRAKDCYGIILRQEG